MCYQNWRPVIHCQLFFFSISFSGMLFTLACCCIYDLRSTPSSNMVAITSMHLLSNNDNLPYFFLSRRGHRTPTCIREKKKTLNGIHVWMVNDSFCSLRWFGCKIAIRDWFIQRNSNCHFGFVDKMYSVSIMKYQNWKKKINWIIMQKTQKWNATQLCKWNEEQYCFATNWSL